LSNFAFPDRVSGNHAKGNVKLAWRDTFILAYSPPVVVQRSVYGR
jgi:hypothetical protein